MNKANFRRRSIAVLALTLVAAGAVVAYTTATASAQGRTINGAFCLPPTPAATTPGTHWFCMQATFGGQTVQGYCNRDDIPMSMAPTDCNTTLASEDPGGTAVPGLLRLRPGTYWITVDDTLNAHNFEFRSCPGSTTPCGPARGFEQELTPICNDDPSNPDVFRCSTTNPQEVAANEIVRTVKVQLEHGWYRLFCDVKQPVDHELRGMYIDIEVGGVGQVG